MFRACKSSVSAVPLVIRSSALTAYLSSLLVVAALGAAPLAAAGEPRARGVEVELPDSAKYWVLFRHLTALETKAAEVERRGLDGAPLRNAYREKAKLTEEQAARMASIAFDCVARVEEKDREAMAVIRAARAAFPGGRLKAGEAPPPPPVELARLEAEREAVIVAARDALFRAFGQEEFARFEHFVEREIGAKLRPQKLNAASGVER